MEERPTGGSTSIRNDVFTALANKRRRDLLRILQRISPANATELATHLVAHEENVSLHSVSCRDAEQTQIALEHVHLPKLVDAELVQRSDDAVETTDHPALTDPKFDDVLTAEADDWDEVLRCLAHRQRRAILTILQREGEMRPSALATEIVERTPHDDRDRGQALESVRTSLHHVHLPMLDDADLVTYDGDDGTVRYDGHPELADEWVAAGVDDAPRAIIAAAERDENSWTVTGREHVTERARALCQSADDELFVMLTVEGLLEQACIRSLRNAADRGVDVYLGAHTSALRTLVREEVPQATIWEPQMDWLNLPPNREKVGRLIMADREAIMIGTVGESDPDGLHRETAITGNGEDNPLVMLLREMLGPRLDRLDGQSEDGRSRIPL